ncbi:MAG: hypothetical protein JWO82_4136 [Akkermansiaceae bacterium]|nr:hypothetical protein [Akkermansiaceae bacterium]
MTGSSVIEALKKQFNAPTDRTLAIKLGVTPQTIHTWKNKEAVSPTDVARLANQANKGGNQELQRNAIRPLVEFFPIKKVTARLNSQTFRIFSHLEKGQIHPYRSGLKQELMEHHGIYVFFDSRGHAIYAGQAKRQSLWKEINSVFNRDRGEVQKIRKVSHPDRKMAYRTSNEKTRQIAEHFVPLHHLAYYFSAYHVADVLIKDLEALLIRSFANHLLNTQMGKFSSQGTAPA